jgi:multidrug resistance efflux pump
MHTGTGSRSRSIVTSLGLALVGAILMLGFETYESVAHGKRTGGSVAEPVQASTALAVSDRAVVLASPGRIEGNSDIVEVGAGIDGVIQAILVKEGQEVKRGQLLAELDCREIQSSLPLAKSEAESLRQVRVRLLRGSRAEERQEARARTTEAKTNLDHAAVQLDRQRRLFEAKIASQSVYDDSRRDESVSQSEYLLAVREEALINAGPLAEEIAKADADVQAAEKRIGLAEDKRSKCVLMAPIDGTVLRVILHPAESFALAAPRPILTIADISGRRVLAEVDERDVSKVHIGQRIEVSSEAYWGKSFTGTVSRVASVMGRKSVITGDPADKNDRDILEVTAQLEPAATALPIGLRATVRFQR